MGKSAVTGDGLHNFLGSFLALDVFVFPLSAKLT